MSICGGGWRSFGPSQAQIQETVMLRNTVAAVELHESKTWSKELAVFSAAFRLSLNELSILLDALTRCDGALGPGPGPHRWTTKSLTSFPLYRTILLWIHLYLVNCRKERSLPLVLALDNITQPPPLDHGHYSTQRRFSRRETFAQIGGFSSSFFFISLFFSSYFFHMGR